MALRPAAGGADRGAAAHAVADDGRAGGGVDVRGERGVAERPLQRARLIARLGGAAWPCVAEPLRRRSNVCFIGDSLVIHW